MLVERCGCSPIRSPTRNVPHPRNPSTNVLLLIRKWARLVLLTVLPLLDVATAKDTPPFSIVAMAVAVPTARFMGAGVPRWMVTKLFIAARPEGRHGVRVVMVVLLTRVDKIGAVRIRRELSPMVRVALPLAMAWSVALVALTPTLTGAFFPSTDSPQYGREKVVTPRAAAQQISYENSGR